MKDVLFARSVIENDKKAIESGTSSLWLMLKAGKAIYSSYDFSNKNTLICCGSGNNGGDGFVLALLLQERGYNCTILTLKNSFTQESVYYYNKCKNSGVNIVLYSLDFDFTPYNVIVDALVGTGLKGQLRDSILELIPSINEAKAYKIAVDIPSGIMGDTGLGEIYVKADMTIAINNLKTGYYFNNGKNACGKICVCDIDIPYNQEFFLFEKSDAGEIFPPRDKNSNKGDYGYCSLIGGSVNYSGASKLANLSLSALKVGSGVSRLCVPSCIVEGVLPYIVESTLFPLDSKDGFIRFNKENILEAISHTKSVAVGMGIGNNKETQKLIKFLLSEYNGTLIIDADGLNALSEIGDYSSSKAKIVLTPHLKEFSRLSKLSIEEINSNPIIIAKDFAKKNNVILLLKGCSSIITDGEKVIINERGTPALSTSGSGDVLSGVLLGLTAFSKADLLQTVACGSYICGLAGEMGAEEENEYSHTAQDTIKYIPKAITYIIK